MQALVCQKNKRDCIIKDHLLFVYVKVYECRTKIIFNDTYLVIFVILELLFIFTLVPTLMS